MPNDSGQLTDEELPGYAYLHCRTPVGAFHKTHVSRLLHLAGEDEQADICDRSTREWYYLGPGAVDPLLDQIKARKTA